MTSHPLLPQDSPRTSSPTSPSISPMRARRTISVTDFRKNPVRHLAGAKGDTLAVLSRNRVEFYAVPPQLFEALLDRIEALGGRRR